MVTWSRQIVLTLYKKSIRYANEVTLSDSKFLIDRIKTEFKKNKSVSDEKQKDLLVQDTMGASIAKLVAIDFGIQWGGFFFANLFKTEKFYDLFGAITNISLTLLSLRLSRSMHLSLAQKVQSSCVILWGARLGLYLFVRILKDGEDKRFRSIKQNPGHFFVAWTLQGFWILFNLLPTLLANLRQSHSLDEPDWRQKFGWLLWLTGFLIEVIADHQKSVFRSDPENAGKFISKGLWSISRHPNYFGEILLWSGLGLAAWPRLGGWERIAAPFSPLFVTFLLTKVSGIPMLERSGMKRWGTDLDYQNYIRNTAVLIPYIW